MLMIRSLEDCSEKTIGDKIESFSILILENNLHRNSSKQINHFTVVPQIHFTSHSYWSGVGGSNRMGHMSTLQPKVIFGKLLNKETMMACHHRL